MQQKQLMILVAVLAVVVIAIVAVVLLIGNKPAAGPAVPGVTPPAAPPVMPGVIPAAGGNVICQMSASGISEGVQMSASGNVKIEKPNKMRMEVASVQNGTTMNLVVIINGDKVYMMMPLLFGTSWVDTSLTELQSSGSDMSSITRIMGMSAQEVENEMKTGSAGDMVTGGIVPTISCAQAGDIPDSEFSLPAGASAKTIAQIQQEMAAAYGGGTI